MHSAPILIGPIRSMGSMAIGNINPASSLYIHNATIFLPQAVGRFIFRDSEIAMLGIYVGASQILLSTNSFLYFV